jgi:hypothetical protein
MSRSAFSWLNLIKKKARSIDELDIGYIQEVKPDLIVAEKESSVEERYYLPKNPVIGFDRQSVYFRIMKGEAEMYRLD